MLNQQIVAIFFDGISHYKLEIIAELLDENCMFYFPKTQPLLSKSRILRFFKILRYQYPRLDFTVQKILIDGDSAAIHWTNQGNDRSGQFYENEGVTLLKEKDGKIVYLSDFFKNTENF